MGETLRVGAVEGGEGLTHGRKGHGGGGGGLEGGKDV